MASLVYERENCGASSCARIGFLGFITNVVPVVSRKLLAFLKESNLSSLKISMTRSG